MKKLSILTAACLLLLSACGGGEDTAVAVQSEDLNIITSEQAQALKNIDNSILSGHARYIIQVNPAVESNNRVRSLGVTATESTGDAISEVSAVRDSLNLQALGVVHRDVLGQTKSFISEVPLNSQKAFLQALKKDPRIISVTPDQVVTTNQDQEEAVHAESVSAQGLSTFPYSANYWWYLDRIDQRALPLDFKYTSTFTAPNVTTYVMDTGITPHSELTSLKPGFTALSDSYGTKDCHGHGTAVASQIAGANIGVAPGTPVVPVRVMGCTGSGLVSDILKGFDWIMANASLPSVVNMSLGTSALSIVDDAVQNMIDRGFTVVAAAGNDNKDACLYSPARLSTAVTVGATNNLDSRSSFSNYGKCVSVFAPGESMMAASNNNTTGYVLASGTSFSSPVTAGVAALILQKKPNWAPSSVKSQIIYQSTKSVVKNSSSTTSNLVYAMPSSLQSLADAQQVYVFGMSVTKTNVSTTSWKENVAIQLKNTAGGNPSGATVYGYFSNNSTLMSCVTNTAGVCTMASATVPATTALTFTVSTVRHANMAYVPKLNKIASVKTVK